MAYNPNNPNGSATSANSAPVVIASDQAAVPVSSTTLATSALQTTGNTSLATLATNLPAKGQAAAASSMPVVIATNQSDIPVASSPAAVLQTPTSNSMAALNATIQYQVEGGAGVFLTLTNAAAATTAWSGTVTFQYSLDGSTWNSFSVMPVSSPANSAAVTTATANGLWFGTIPAGTVQNQGSTVAYVRANMTAYTSGTAYFFVQSSAVPNARILLPWIYSVTSGATLVGPIEASGFSEVAIQLSAVTTTVLTAQGTNDPSLTTWQTIPVIQGQAIASSATTMTAASTYRFNPNGYKWTRIQVTTTGTVLTVQGVNGTLGQQIILTSIGNDMGVTINAGTLPTVTTVGTVSSITAGTITTVGSVTAVAAINSVATTNGLTLGTQITPTTPAALSVKASAGRLHFLQLGNPNTTAVYLKIYNAASVTLGTTSAAMNFYVPASSSIAIPINAVGLYFSTGIFIAVTGAASLTDNTAITTGCELNYSFI